MKFKTLAFVLWAVGSAVYADDKIIIRAVKELPTAPASIANTQRAL